MDYARPDQTVYPLGEILLAMLAGVEEREGCVGEVPWLAARCTEWMGLRRIVEITGVTSR